MRKKLKWAGAIVALIFIGLQFTSPVHTNPPFNEAQALQGIANVPPDISAVFARSCTDCHSNQTNWRWYTYVAPVSWFTVGHVKEGRAELNFSEWGRYGSRMKQTRLHAICEQSEKGTMPIASYTFVHRDAQLSRDEARAICEWTKLEGQRLTAK